MQLCIRLVLRSIFPIVPLCFLLSLRFSHYLSVFPIVFVLSYCLSVFAIVLVFSLLS